MDSDDLKSLEEAVGALERPTFAMRIVNLIGVPIEAATKLLPARAAAAVSRATTLAVRKALVAAVSTMGKKRRPASKWLHRAAVVSSGGVGGFFGLPGLAVELPISTVIMLRAIADIARSEGEDLGSVEGQLACVEVFALGGPSPTDDASESAYYAVRIALAKSLTEAAEHIAARGLAEGAPAVVRLIARIAARFDVVVSEKLAAQAVPVVGAASGAAINLLFASSFQKTASGHFTIRRLERKYGLAVVKAVYETIARSRRDRSS
ncbi:MAG: EcsC family protein [Thermoanaerobaculia bacterium]